MLDDLASLPNVNSHERLLPHLRYTSLVLIDLSTKTGLSTTAGIHKYIDK